MNSLSLWQDSLQHIALKGTVLLAMAWLMGFVWMRLSAARRYHLWLSAMLAAVALPLVMPFVPMWQVLPAMPAPAREQLIPTPPPTPSLVGHKKEPTGGEPLEKLTTPTISKPAPATVVQEVTAAEARPPFNAVSILPGLWLAGLGLLLSRIGISAFRLHRLARTLKTLPHGDSRHQATEAAAAELGLKQIPHILLGPPDAIPMVWGIFRPHLLLPEGSQDWPSEKLRAVLLHELSHLKRRDPLALIVAQHTQAVYWFNPLAWLIFRRLRADQERACDDAVLSQGVLPSTYAQHLLDLSRSTRLAPGLSLCALAMARTAPVESRVTDILDPKRRREPASRRWSALLVILGLTLVFPLAMLHALEAAKLRGRILDRNGTVLAYSSPTLDRYYPMGDTTSHVLGYTVTPKPGAVMARQTGTTAIEKQADITLHSGQDVKLTLDARIQSLAHQAMTEAGVVRGTMVVLDPNNGDVLAMVSLPTFDANRLISRMPFEEWDRLLKDTNAPLQNRAARAYVPGSTYMGPVALAGGLAGVDHRHFACTGTVTYGSRALQCWIHRRNEGAHGTLGLSDALRHSCNCFFYQYGNAAGINSITKMSRMLGLGEKTDIGLDSEDTGFLPNPEEQAKKDPKSKWTLGETANASIGQGNTLATPLQMSVVAATIANGGRVPKPRLIDDGTPGTWRTHLTEEGITSAQIEVIRQAYRDNVNTPGVIEESARSQSHLIAGDSGTAQYWRRLNNVQVTDLHRWFIGFAPYDKPKLAFAILVQGDEPGWKTCCLVARQLVDSALALPEKAPAAPTPPPPVSAPPNELKPDLEEAFLNPQSGPELDRIFLDIESQKPLPPANNPYRMLLPAPNSQFIDESPRKQHNMDVIPYTRPVATPSAKIRLVSPVG